MCFSYDAGCHVILYVILTASNTFTDWQLIFSCFFLRWPFDSLELFSSSSELLFCCPVDHACTTHSIRIGEVIIWFSFSVVSTKIEICWFSLLYEDKTGTEVLRTFCFLELLSLSYPELSGIWGNNGQCSSSNRCLTMLRLR